MSNSFLKARPSAYRSVQACFAAATLALVCGSTAAIAADMPLKAAEAPPYQWSGVMAESISERALAEQTSPRRLARARIYWVLIPPW